MRTLLIVIVMVVGLFFAYHASTLGDGMAADLIAVAVGVYFWRQARQGGTLAIVGLVSGLIVLGVAAAATRRDATAANWASTATTVDWATATCHAAISFSHWPSRPEARTNICVSRIYYRYRVGDRDYAGTRVTFNDLLLNDLDWNWEAKYQDNRHVSVRYDPADPAVAVLEPRTPGRTLLWVVGVWFTLSLGHAFLTNRDEAGHASE